MKKVEDSGLVQVWRLIILNPHLLNREAGSIVLDVNDEGEKSAVISKLNLIDGIVMIND